MRTSSFLNRSEICKTLTIAVTLPVALTFKMYYRLSRSRRDWQESCELWTLSVSEALWWAVNEICPQVNFDKVFCLTFSQSVTVGFSVKTSNNPVVLLTCHCFKLQMAPETTSWFLVKTSLSPLQEAGWCPGLHLIGWPIVCTPATGEISSVKVIYRQQANKTTSKLLNDMCRVSRLMEQRRCGTWAGGTLKLQPEQRVWCVTPLTLPATYTIWLRCFPPDVQVTRPAHTDTEQFSEVIQNENLQNSAKCLNL